MSKGFKEHADGGAVLYPVGNRLALGLFSAMATGGPDQLCSECQERASPGLKRPGGKLAALYLRWITRRCRAAGSIHRLAEPPDNVKEKEVLSSKSVLASALGSSAGGTAVVHSSGCRPSIMTSVKEIKLPRPDRWQGSVASRGSQSEAGSDDPRIRVQGEW